MISNGSVSLCIKSVEVKSQVMLKNIQFSKSKIHVDEVHIEASAEISDS